MIRILYISLLLLKSLLNLNQEHGNFKLRKFIQVKEHIKTGRVGEKLALQYLIKKGYKIVETNYRNLIGEIDIIANYKNIFVFIEVKTSYSLKFGRPKERINYHKINKIKNVAIAYLKYKKLLDCVSFRFDCIEIIGNSLDYEIEHLENIF